MRLDQNEQDLQQFTDQGLFNTFKQNLCSKIVSKRSNLSKLNKEIKAQIETFKVESADRLNRIEKELNALKNQLFVFSERKSTSERDSILQSLEFEKFFEFEINQLAQFKLIKSSVNKSEQAMISRNEHGRRIKNLKEGYIFTYCNFIIDPKLKYLIKMEISNSSKNGYQLIGLMEDELKETKLYYDMNLAYSNYSKVYGLTKKIKGECFTSTLRNVDKYELHIHICLGDKQFVVFDFPEKNSIFALQESAIQDKKYRLGFELYYAEDAITIKELRIVESFPSLL